VGCRLGQGFDMRNLTNDELIRNVIAASAVLSIIMFGAAALHWVNLI
jgi:hypothetical protein